MIRIFILIAVIIAGMNYYVSAKGYSGPKSDHFDGTRFHNLTASTTPSSFIADDPIANMTFFDFIKQKFKSPWKVEPLSIEAAVPAQRVEGKEIVVTLVNHSTLLIQTEGLNILTDPVWSEKAGPFYMGLKRYTPPGIEFDKLPPIDFILLSHNHYDHMDVETLKKLSKRDKPIIYTGLGNKAYLEKREITNVFEMDWGDRKVFSDLISIDTVPAQHFTARGLTDRNKTLWVGFVLHTPNGDIYFAGDTGYGPFIERIQKAYPGGFRLAFLPIGAYEPRSFMKPMHMSPSDAVRMYKDLKVQNAFGIHFGTFNLGTESRLAPKEAMDELLKLPENLDVHFKTYINGEVMDLK